ncbi:MAG: antibiotic biosynthesis monooxygenase [Thermoanaerobaculia bacterium]
MPESFVTVLIEYQALPDQAANAVARLERLVATVVREEADCFGIRLLEDSADSTRLLLEERWSSQEAYLGPHFQTAHLQEFIADAAALFAGRPGIRFWRCRSEHLPG